MAAACPYCGRELVDQVDAERGHCGWCREFAGRVTAEWERSFGLRPEVAFTVGLRMGREILERHKARERG